MSKSQELLISKRRCSRPSKLQQQAASSKQKVRQQAAALVRTSSTCAQADSSRVGARVVVCGGVEEVCNNSMLFWRTACGVALLVAARHDWVGCAATCAHKCICAHGLLWVQRVGGRRRASIGGQRSWVACASLLTSARHLRFGSLQTCSEASARDRYRAQVAKRAAFWPTGGVLSQ